MPTKSEQREATREALVAQARLYFAEKGYAEAATPELMARVGLTRGALYHHFGSKEGLFRAVVETLQSEIATEVEQAADAMETPWDGLEAGCLAFLEAATRPEMRRILLIDAPAALGWDAWREMDARGSGRLLTECLRALMAAGELPELPAEALSQMLSGAMNEAALWIARAERPDNALNQSRQVLLTLLRALRGL